MADIIDGRVISKKLKDELKLRVDELKNQGIECALAFIQVGEDEASTVYMNSQQKGCAYVGIRSIEVKLPTETTQEELLKLIHDLNDDSSVNGILVETPVPDHINLKAVISAIDPRKDMDGFHPYNMGMLTIGGKSNLPCTPAGVVELLKRSGYELEGKNCVVVGRSHNVGIPAAQLMLRENATVTIAHSRTKNLQEVCKQADILIVAVGKKKLITKDYVKQGAIVVDVGIHVDEDGSLCGDVDYKDVFEVAGAITPVPGGVGPMTIVMLLNSCLDSIKG